MEEVIGAGIGVGTNIMNNMWADDRAKQSTYRQRRLADKQFQHNSVLAKMAASQQTEGARMAGLNPALQGNMPPVQNVSQGNADMAQTIPFNVSDLLLGLQAKKMEADIENTEADTNKKMTEQGNVNADTDKKIAEKLKIDQDTQNIKNINEQYAHENNMLKEAGKGMAEKWQAEPWFNNLGSDTKNTIDAIAAGELPLTVGSIAALKKVIETQKDLSDADATMVKNAFSNALLDSQFSDKAVMDALTKLPKVQYDKMNAEKDKILAEIPEVKAKIANLLKDLDVKNLTIKDMKNKIRSFEAGDLDYLKSKGEYGKWFEKYSEEMLQRLLPMLTTGLGASKVLNPSNGRSNKKSESGYDWKGSGFEDGNVGTQNKPYSSQTPYGIGEKPEGVSQFDWNQVQKRARKR